MLKKALYLTLTTLAVTSCSSNQLKDQTVEEKKAEVYYGRGTEELISKNYGPALTYLTQARDLNPKDSQIRNNLGMAYYFREQPVLAETELKEAINIDPKNSDARINLGSLYMEKNRFKEAREQFERVEKDLTFNNQFRNYYNLAMLSLKEGDRRSAFEYLAKSVKEREDYCAAHYKLGEMYAEEYRFSQALESFRNAGKGTCVKEPAPYYQQALTLINLNKPAEAKRKLLEITDKFPSTRFSSMAVAQLRKLESMPEGQSSTRASQTEVIKESRAVETPNF